MLHASFHRTSFRAIKRSRNARCSSLSITINERAFYRPSLVTRPSIFPSLRFCVSRPPSLALLQLSSREFQRFFSANDRFFFLFFYTERKGWIISQIETVTCRRERKKKKTRGEGNLRKRRGAFIYKRAFFINNNVGRNLWRDRPAATDDYVDDASRVDAFEIHRVFPFESINGMRWTEGGDWLFVSLVMKNR